MTDIIVGGLIWTERLQKNVVKFQNITFFDEGEMTSKKHHT